MYVFNDYKIFPTFIYASITSFFFKNLTNLFGIFMRKVPLGKGLYL